MSYLAFEHALAHGFGRRYAQLRTAWAIEAVALQLHEQDRERARGGGGPGLHGGPVDPHTTAVIVNRAAAEGA